MISQLGSKPIKNAARAARTESQRRTKWLAVLGVAAVLLAATAVAATRLSAYQQTLTNPADPQTQRQVFIVPKSELPISKAPISQKDIASQPSKNASPAFVASQQTASKNNVTAQLRGVGIGGGAVEADVCLQLPSNADWLPEAQITMAGKTIAADTMQLVEAKNPATYASSNRCYKFGFPLQLPTESTASNMQVQVTVTRLVKSLPEVSSEQAANTAASAFGEIVEGPWAFTTTIQ